MAAFSVADGYPSFIKDQTNKFPSRHLYVKILSRKVEEHELLHLYSQYGDTESIGFLRGRSYNFISYTEAAIVADKQLNKFPLHGLPMTVEFKKLFTAAGIAAGNRKVEYSNGPNSLECIWIPPSDRSSQDLTYSSVTMYTGKIMRYDSVPDNIKSHRLDFASFSNLAELDCSKKYIWEATVAKGGCQLFRLDAS